MRFDIITIFPKIFGSYFSESILKRAQARKLITIKTYNLRDFTADKHHKVDDSPYGGGPGMVLKIEPIYQAIQFLKRHATRDKRHGKTWVVLFSTRGKKFDAKAAKRLSKYDRLILICGRYEGVDERVAQYIADEEISMGDYILSGGELPAMILVEAVSRFIPGVLGKPESLEEIKGSYPVFTKPAGFVATSDMGQGTRKKRTWKVPKVLLIGDHKKIGEWRKEAGS